MLTVRIEGGYAWVFNEAHSVVEVAAIKPPAGDAAKCFLDHPMGLSVDKALFETQLQKFPGSNDIYMLPESTLTFSGIQQNGQGLTGFAKTDQESLSVPVKNWNDVGLIPDLGQTASGWRDRTSARLRLTDGTLTVNAPSGSMPEACWNFRPALKRPPSPIIESVVYTVPFTGNSVELRAGNDTVGTFKTEGDFSITITSPPHLLPVKDKYVAGEAVTFYAMFSELTDPKKPCEQRPVPVFIACAANVAGESKNSSGNFCPTGRFTSRDVT
jgi:hypothetical protein